jgi:ribosome-associated protein
VRALRVELEKALDASKTRIVGVDAASESGWAVMDAFDVMVHIFTPDTRARYKLEQLWRDGEDVPVTPLLGGKIPAKKKPAKAKPIVRKKAQATKKSRK